MKRKIYWGCILLAILLTVGALAAINVFASAEAPITVTVSMPEGAKIGESWSGQQPTIRVDGPVTIPGAGIHNTTFVAHVISAGCGSQYITSSQSASVDLMLLPTDRTGTVNYENYKLMNLMGTPLYVLINGTMTEAFVEQNWIDTPEYSGSCIGIHVRASVPLNLSDREVYQISLDDSDLPDDVSLDFGGIPTQTEPGVEISAFIHMRDYTYVWEVEGLLVNGAPCPYDFESTPTAAGEKIRFSFTMPAEDLVFSVKLRNKYEGSVLLKDLNISFDIPDDEYFYGSHAPDNEDMLDYIKAITSSAYPDLEFEILGMDAEFHDDGYLPWLGNYFCSFWIQAPEGYLFLDPTQSSTEPFEDPESGRYFNSPAAYYLDNQFQLTVNGNRVVYAYSMEKMQLSTYADGMFVSPYYTSRVDILEIHVIFRGHIQLDLDLSDYQSGDTVVIPEDAVALDNSMTTGYVHDHYTVTGYQIGTAREDGNGYDFQWVDGNTFIMPDAEDVIVVASVLYGQDPTKQSANSDGKVYLEVPEGTFDGNTMLQIDIVDENDDQNFTSAGGESAWDVMERVNGSIGEYVNDAVIYELSAFAFGEYIQPGKKIAVTFTIPEGFDMDSVALYYVAEDGTHEKMQVEVDPEAGVCHVYITHFSTYVLASCTEKNASNEHIVHQLTQVPEDPADSCTDEGHTAYYTCSGCDKWFADDAAEVEITDKESVKLTGEHEFTVQQSDEDSHWNKCAHCDEIDGKLPHTYGDDKLCTVCGVKDETPIPETKPETVPHTGDSTVLLICLAWMALGYTVFLLRRHTLSRNS